MEYVALSIDAENTKGAILATKKEDIIVKKVFTYGLNLSTLETGNIHELSIMFKQCVGKHRTVFITYPGILGRLDCFSTDAVSNDNLPAQIYGLLDIAQKEDYYIDSPLQLPRQGGLYVTAVSVHRKYIEAICQAKKFATIGNLSVEPAPLALARVINDWSNVSYIVEIDEENTMITCYDPRRGMFSMRLEPSLGWREILDEGQVDTFCQNLILADVASKKTFGRFDREAISIYIVSPRTDDLSTKIETAADSDRIKRIQIPDFVINQSGVNLDQHITAIGAGLKVRFEELNNNHENLSSSQHDSGRMDRTGQIRGTAARGLSLIKKYIRRVSSDRGA
jgi:hypothetical protein